MSARDSFFVQSDLYALRTIEAHRDFEVKFVIEQFDKFSDAADGRFDDW